MTATHMVPTLAAPSHKVDGVWRLTVLGIAVTLAMLAAGAGVLLQMRVDAWRQAEQSAANLVLALERDIGRNLRTYDLSLQGAVNTSLMPGLEILAPDVRQAAIFDSSVTNGDLGSMLILNADGTVKEDSTAVPPRSHWLGDRDYFTVHRDNPDAGLFISRPFDTRKEEHETAIAISRRIEAPGGGFGGAVMGCIKLSYFTQLFSRLHVGDNGSVKLVRTDGTLIARYPQSATPDNATAAQAGLFSRTEPNAGGTFVAASSTDGAERLYTFQRVGEMGLVVVVGMAATDIFASWWDRTVTVGGILFVLCLGIIGLCILFHREMGRRVRAEAALAIRASSLEVLAATDALTGLGNRRSFEVDLTRSWRLAARGETPLSLLILDADCFKLYNDRYGHSAGDEVLRAIAAAINGAIHRPADQAARHGGEEFAVMLPDTDAAGALDVAERIRSDVAALAIAHGGTPSGVVTVSIGVATAYPDVKGNKDALIEAADAALYEAKHAGRNRVCCLQREAVPALPFPVAALS